MKEIKGVVICNSFCQLQYRHTSKGANASSSSSITPSAAAIPLFFAMMRLLRPLRRRDVLLRLLPAAAARASGELLLYCRCCESGLCCAPLLLCAAAPARRTRSDECYIFHDRKLERPLLSAYHTMFNNRQERRGQKIHVKDIWLSSLSHPIYCYFLKQDLNGTRIFQMKI